MSDEVRDNAKILIRLGEKNERFRMKAFLRSLSARYGYVPRSSPYEDGFLEALAQVEAELDSPTIKIQNVSESSIHFIKR